MDRTLRQFLAIAECGGISKAARSLNVTQPTLTFNLKKLEATLGVELFMRGPHGMELTEYGEILRDHARLMQRLNDNAEANIDTLRLRKARALRLGCGHAWWLHFVKHMISDYAKDFPIAPLHIDMGSQLHGLAHLLSGDIDLFVAHRLDKLSPRLGVDFLPLFLAQDAYFVRADHPLIGQSCTTASLNDYAMVDTVPYEIRHKQIIRRHDLPEKDPTFSNPLQKTLTSNSFAACIDLVLLSDGIMIYPEVMRDYLDQRGIVALEVTDAPKKTVGIYRLGVHSRDKRLADIVARLEASARALLPRLFP